MNRPVPDEVILGLLKAQPTHGYDLLDRFRSREHLGRIWTLSTSQLYAVLKRLEEAKAIFGKEIDVLNAPARTRYSITDIGNQKLEAWLYEKHPSNSIHLIRVVFLSRIYIANLLGLDADQIILNQITACQQQYQKIFDQRYQVKSPVESLTLDFVLRQLESALKWLDETDFLLEIS